MPARIGIPYAFVEVTADGQVRTCPVCGEKCIDPVESFDATGEMTAPSAYQDHYAAMHAEADESQDAYDRASADFVVPINANEMTRLREALTTARNAAETQSGPGWSNATPTFAAAARERAVAYNDLLARLRQIESAR